MPALHQFLFPPSLPGEGVLVGCETLSLNVSGFMLNSKSERHLVLQESLKVLGIGAVIWDESSHDVMVGR